jgi:phage-Barnase-EndoU-ColicinE5/D-RelE like nuclease2
LTEGDALAVGLYKAMLSLRSPNDIKEEKFHDHEELREDTIEEPDEIWRSTDLSGNALVTFVKQFDEGDSDGIWYVAVTVEDEASSSHALLFSFPTTDENLIDRYRHGENLQAEEVTQEASH